MKHPFFVLALCFFVSVSCSKGPQDPLQKVLQSDHPAIAKVMKDPGYYEVQILYTEIERDAEGKVHFIDHSFQVDSTHYFYPASTVKLPAAVLALELMDGSDYFSPETTYFAKNDTIPHSIADDVRQIFAVSDNQAYNRLYEFLGRDRMNLSLEEKGIFPIRIAHRLSTENAANPRADTLQVTLNDTLVNWHAGIDKPVFELHINNLKKGKGFMQNDSLIEEPMDFAKKNYFPLHAQHGLMKRLFFPENFKERERFALSEETHSFLKEQMHTVPRRNGYDETEYYDGYCKFFLFGDSKKRIPDHIKTYNKVGYAYGTVTDTAYIVDEKEGVDFLLSATILVNENGIFNDDTYEYDEIGIPFLAQLGREIHAAEVQKKKANLENP